MPSACSGSSASRSTGLGSPASSCSPAVPRSSSSARRDLEQRREPVPAVDLAAVTAAETRIDRPAANYPGDACFLRSAEDLRAGHVSWHGRECIFLSVKSDAGLLRAGVGSAGGVAGQDRAALLTCIAAVRPQRHLDARLGRGGLSRVLTLAARRRDEHEREGKSAGYSPQGLNGFEPVETSTLLVSR